MTDKPIAVVTGGAQGIGRACAEALISDGYRAVLVDIQDKVAETAAEIGQGTTAYVCDMGDAASVQALFDDIAADEGPISATLS